MDLVLPSREPIGLLLPEVLWLLDDEVSARPQLRHLVRADGSVLAEDGTLESAGVADGAVLRLVRVEDAPSAPVVHDVTDETAGDLDVRAWRWGPETGQAVAGVAAVVWAGVAGVLAREEFGDLAVGGVLVAVAVLQALAGALLGRARRHGLAATLIASATVVGVLGAWTLGDAYDWPGAVQLAAVAGAVTFALVLLGVFTPFGRGGLVGAAALGATAGAWEVALAVQSGGRAAEDAARAGALLAVLSVVVLGVLPRLALMASGLSGLDDKRSAGVSVSRYQVTVALAATHRGLVLATVVVSASAAVAGVLVLRSVSVWTVLLAIGATLVLALRARAFPLTVEVVAALVAAAVVAVRLVWVWLDHTGAAGPLAALVAFAALLLVVQAVRPAEHVRVRLRRLGDVLESVGAIALFPLVIGAFGVYGRLLDTFA
ncbi:type VII secretion integral membrane protein EccD [Streptomyces sp. NA04227]|uniref:type VII secretion integral membrane protein EccD n=1 Tax=Streptomyces sp. NA04227 TaxID=2742136 RepID=UPI0020CA85B0|nr:type VII secretion integral membrane protein EccD [Streptomyces sp. NA04227]